MEMGCDGVLINSAIANSKNPVSDVRTRVVEFTAFDWRLVWEDSGVFPELKSVSQHQLS